MALRGRPRAFADYVVKLDEAAMPNGVTIEKELDVSEDDLVPLSALQHLVFCERQCALIHIEQTVG